MAELRKLRDGRAPDLNHRVVRSRIDHLALRGALRPGARESFEQRMEALVGATLRVSDRVLNVERGWEGRWSDQFPVGYARTFVFEDERDDTRVAFVGLGLRRGWYLDGCAVRITATGQGCARGLLPGLIQELAGGLLIPGSIAVDVDVAVDLAVDPGALLPIEIGDTRGGLRRVRSFWGQNPQRGRLGCGLELGSRSSRRSLSFYDKVAQVESAREPGPRQMTWLAGRYALPDPAPPDLVRAELRVRGIVGTPRVAEVVIAEARRFALVDLRRVAIADGFDELLIMKSREWGVVRAIPAAATQREALLDAREAGVAYLPARGLAAGVQRSLLEAGRSDREARRHAVAVRDRALELLNEGAARTAFDFPGAVARVLRADWSPVQEALLGL